MKIWLINHYAVPPQYYPLARQTYFAKYLMAMGHEVTIFAASTVHNSDKNLITDRAKWREETVDGVHYVYIKCKDYLGSGLKRVYNICEFAWKLPGVCKRFPKPDAIVATSMPPTSCAMGIRLARKYGCRGIAEIADLWPESIVAYGIAGPKNPAVIALRWLEKWIYKKADAVVFTMEGAYDYILEQGWEKDIPRSKVFHINNGVNLEDFEVQCVENRLEDPDLLEEGIFKVVYAGSIRRANGLSELVACAELLQDHSDIRFLVYGAGDDLEQLREQVAAKKLCNILFKGPVPKKNVPFVLAQSSVNLLNYNIQTAHVYKYGSSQNKLFEYMASGKPILSNIAIAYSVVERYQCGISRDITTAQAYADAILELYRMNQDEYARMCENSKQGARDYDFRKLTEKLIRVIEGSN